MSASLTHILRYPIKSLGREELGNAELRPNACIKGDRLWGVTHEQSKIEDGAWARCRNFLRVTHGPGLAPVTAHLDDASGRVTLDHPFAGRHQISPDAPDAFDGLSPWLAKIWPDTLPAPTGLYAYAAGLTDAPDPWISIHTHASHRALEERAGEDVSIHRWRGNLWIDGTAPWAEFDWIDQEIRIGDTRLRVMDRISRCKMTHANPDTGVQDIDMLAVLRTWGHQDFGVLAQVIDGGPIRPGDAVVV